MVFNEKEQEILKIVGNKNVDFNQISNLLKDGANVNASNGVVNDEYLGSLFSECIYESIANDTNILDLLKCFIENGFDLDKYASSIIGDLHVISYDKIIEVIKYILNNVKNKINVDYGIKTYKIESEFVKKEIDCNNKKSNTFDTVVFLLEEYRDGSDYNIIYDYSKIIGQTVLDVTIDNVATSSNQNYLGFSSKNVDYNLIINCINDSLCICNSDIVYINNNYKKFTGVSSEFITYLKKKIIGEKIKRIEFENMFEKKAARECISGRNVRIIFSNNHELFYKKISNDKIIMRIIDLNDSKLLKSYRSVFVEQAENFLDSNYCVIPDLEKRYKIGHNCNISRDNRMSFVFSQGETEKEYISIDNESLNIFMPYFTKHIMGFDSDKKVCKISSEEFINIRNSLETLIRKIENNMVTDKEYIDCFNNFIYFIMDDDEMFNDSDYDFKEYIFNLCKEEIISFIKAFIWYINDYKGFNEIGDDRILNIYKY